MKPRRRLGAIAGLLLLAGGCGSSGGASERAGTSDVALPATAPYLAMSSAARGVAVWPSGSAWVVLSTTDGFAHVTNRTPVGVETDGGLVAAVTADRAVTAVGAHERLVRSPILASGPAWRWDADELPGAVAGSRTAVSVTPETAVITAHSGTLERHGARGWTPVTSGASLTRGLVVAAVTWVDVHTGWLTGSARDGAAAAYETRDGGATWTAVAQTAGSSTQALPPCGAGRSWLMPVVRSENSVSVLRSIDGGAHWTSGAPEVPASAAPVMGCAGDVVWLAARRHGRDRILSSPDGGATWTDRGAAPAGLTDLTPTIDGAGFAASAGAHPTLWRVTGDGAQFTRIALPGWVVSLGGQTSGGS